ncbi:hypothetical protein HZH68_002763 [Vespula germanica]|uniref:Uncharacterized protein n=1 Tax=Vespula germanica TaxID=30212 RepID=A0A834NMW2_VESGE|nr:hypothetical protein HZH68_002763 [Vespula germanica]
MINNKHLTNVSACRISENKRDVLRRQGSTIKVTDVFLDVCLRKERRGGRSVSCGDKKKEKRRSNTTTTTSSSSSSSSKSNSNTTSNSSSNSSSSSSSSSMRDRKESPSP